VVAQHLAEDERVGVGTVGRQEDQRRRAVERADRKASMDSGFCTAARSARRARIASSTSSKTRPSFSARARTFSRTAVDATICSTTIRGTV
jgi:hypothetical protein